jgi:hypothetical protein
VAALRLELHKLVWLQVSLAEQAWLQALVELKLLHVLVELLLAVELIELVLAREAEQEAGAVERRGLALASEEPAEFALVPEEQRELVLGLQALLDPAMLELVAPQKIRLLRLVPVAAQLVLVLVLALAVMVLPGLQLVLGLQEPKELQALLV